MPETPSKIEDAAAQLLIELAFLLPKGTDLRTHPISNKLVAYKNAIESEHGQKYNRLKKLMDDLRCMACCKKIVFFHESSVVGGDCYQALQQENERLDRQVADVQNEGYWCHRSQQAEKVMC